MFVSHLITIRLRFIAPLSSYLGFRSQRIEEQPLGALQPVVPNVFGALDHAGRRLQAARGKGSALASAAVAGKPTAAFDRKRGIRERAGARGHEGGHDQKAKKGEEEGRIKEERMMGVERPVESIEPAV